MTQSKLTPEDRSTILNWIHCDKMQLRIIFKASEDGGCNAGSFHKKCDGQGATVTVAYNTTGYVFGAYTSQNFSSKNDKVSDKKHLLFRLREAGEIAYSKYSAPDCSCICNNSSYGPCFEYKNEQTRDRYYRGSYSSFHTETGQVLTFFRGDNPIQRNGIIVCNGQGLQPDSEDCIFDDKELSWGTLSGNNNVLLDFEVYKVEANPTVAEPWRKNKIQWNEKERNLLKEQITSYKPVSLINVPVVNILLLGQVGAGKSSFFNTVNSVFHGYVTTQAIAGSSNHSLTTEYRTYRPRLERGGPTLNFRLCDTMGLEEDSGMDVSNFSLIIGGNVRDRFQFYPDTGIGNDNPNLKKDVKLKDKIHVAAFVVDGSTIQVMSVNVLNKLRQIKKQVDRLRIPSAILLTKIDKVCSMAAENTSKVYHSPQIRDSVDVVAEKMGVPRSQVLVVKNYENDTEVDSSTDIITLVALQQLLRLADSFFDDQIDLLNDVDDQTQEERFVRNL